MKPRMPNSPPAVPTIARSRMTSGAMVMTSAIAGSAILRSHTTSPVCLVDREHAPVEGDRDHLVLPQGDAAVVDAAARHVTGPGAVGAGVHLPLDDALFAGAEIDRIDRSPAVRHVHDAVLDDRRRFEIAERVTPAALEPAQRHREGRFQVLHRVGVDFLEQRIAVALIIAVMQNPVLRLALRIERAGIASCRRHAPASVRLPSAT